MTAVTGLPTTLPWTEGTNRVLYVADDSELSGNNVVKGGTCAKLVINESAGIFRPAQPFTATDAAYTCTVGGQHIVQLPFTAAVPDGVTVYTLDDNLQPLAVSTVPANQPVLVEAQGEVTFRGAGEVSYVPCPLSDAVLPIATPTSIKPISVTPEGERTEAFPQESLDGVWYNLHGQRVATSHHGGVVIREGRKIIKK